MKHTIQTWLVLIWYTVKTWLLLMTIVFLGLLGTAIAFLIAVLHGGSLFFLSAGLTSILVVGGCWLLVARRITSRSQVFLAGAILLSFLMAVLSFLAAAKLTDSIPLLILVAALTLSLCFNALSRIIVKGKIVVKRQRLRRQHYLPWIMTSETLLLLGLLANQLVFQPFDLPQASQSPPPEVNFWQLSTGSRIAYTHVPAVNTPKPTPVVFLHGGLVV